MPSKLRETRVATFRRLGAPQGCGWARLSLLFCNLARTRFRARLGWRVPSLLGGVLALIGYLIRKSCDTGLSGQRHFDHAWRPGNDNGHFFKAFMFDILWSAGLSLSELHANRCATPTVWTRPPALPQGAGFYLEATVRRPPGVRSDMLHSNSASGRNFSLISRLALSSAEAAALIRVSERR